MSELMICGGTLINPETMRREAADVLCRDGRIEAILPAGSACPDGVQRLNADGCFVCPGFIDPHSHIDGHVYTGQLSLMQGITTTVGGNCGFSPVDMAHFFDAQRAFPVNQAELIGQCALREAVGVYDPSVPASAAQAAQMAKLAREALRQGAAGISLGPSYAPGTSMEEMLVLCQTAQEFGRPVAIDTRMHSMTDLHSLTEAIELAEQTQCRMVISHFVYQYGVGVEYEALEMIDDARERGVDVVFDSGMYKDWCSAIGSALFEPEMMRKNSIELWHLRMLTGAHIGCVPDQALYEHLRAEHPQDAVLVNTGDQEAVYAIARHPLAMVSTDAGAYRPNEGHPQIAGSFPRYLREMVRERRELSWEEAVRHAALLPAQVFGLKHKGRVTPGCDADLVVFDPETVEDRADYPGLGNPDAAPVGIRHVVVGGKAAVQDGCMTGVLAGQVIRMQPVQEAKRGA